MTEDSYAIPVRTIYVKIDNSVSVAIVDTTESIVLIYTDWHHIRHPREIEVGALTSCETGLARVDTVAEADIVIDRVDIHVIKFRSTVRHVCAAEITHRLGARHRRRVVQEIKILVVAVGTVVIPAGIGVVIGDGVMYI